VIRRTDGHASVCDVRDEPTERCAVRQQNREVIQPNSPAPRYGSGAAAFVQYDERRSVLWPERRRPVVL
jgi:hypothetical protein